MGSSRYHVYGDTRSWIGHKIALHKASKGGFFPDSYPHIRAGARAMKNAQAIFRW